jgi:hypothetical protein
MHLRNIPDTIVRGTHPSKIAKVWGSLGRGRPAPISFWFPALDEHEYCLPRRKPPTDGTGSPCLWVRNNLMPYHPAPSRPFGISGLVGFCDLISGLLSVRGKILSYHEFILECHFCELYCPYLILQYGPLKSSSIEVVDSEVRCHSLCSWQPPWGNHSKTGNFFSDKHLCGNLKVLRQRPDVFHR